MCLDANAVTQAVRKSVSIPGVFNDSTSGNVDAGGSVVGLHGLGGSRLRLQNDTPDILLFDAQGVGVRRPPWRCVNHEAAANVRRVAEVVRADVNDDHGVVRQLLAAGDEAAVREGAVLLEEDNVEEEAEADGEHGLVQDGGDLVLRQAGDETRPHGPHGGHGAGVYGAQQLDLGGRLELPDELCFGAEADGAEACGVEAADDVVAHFLVGHERRGLFAAEEPRLEERRVRVPVLFPDDNVQLFIARRDTQHANAALFEMRRQKRRLCGNTAVGGGLRHDEHEERPLLGLPGLPILLRDVAVVLERVARLKDEGVDVVGGEGLRETVSAEEELGGLNGLRGIQEREV